MERVLQPDYVSSFSCIASQCEDTCCRGWRIAIDVGTYECYKRLMADGDSVISEGHFSEASSAALPGAAAEIVLRDNGCPFLDEEKLCAIQTRHGADHLSLVCGFFPRHFIRVNGALEMSLKLSCPEAARLALLNRHPMRFSQIVVDADARPGIIPSVELVASDNPDGFHLGFGDIRGFVVELLQNRAYPFEDRLVILGRFCEDLRLIHDNSTSDEFLGLIAEYRYSMNAGGFSAFIQSIPDYPAAQLKTLIILIEYRLKTDATGSRFLECFELFKKGLHYETSMPDELLSESYRTVKQSYYDPFMIKHEWIFENYFVNYVFRSIFPFGRFAKPRESDGSASQATAFTDFFSLAIQYAMIKNLLIGMSGCLQDRFEIDSVVKLIQTFEKNVGSDDPYQHTLLSFFRENNSVSVASATMFIKN